jgi:hypothetical protein
MTLKNQIIYHEKELLASIYRETEIINKSTDESLIIPIKVNVLKVEDDLKTVVNQDALFQNLPYKDKETNLDMNSAKPYISSTIEAEPFQDKSLQLEKGIHLHWSFPEFFLQGKQEINSEDAIFPELPNRWLIRRRHKKTVEKQWVIESDYITNTPSNSRVSIYYAKDDGNGKTFRFQGRRMPLDAWNNETETAAEYLEHLSVEGYGNPNFAEFYPNCHSVFGFVDKEVDFTKINDIEYELIGWYNKVDKNPLFKLRADLINEKSFSPLYNMNDVIDWQILLSKLKELKSNEPVSIFDPYTSELILKKTITDHQKIEIIDSLNQYILDGTMAKAFSWEIKDKNLKIDQQLLLVNNREKFEEKIGFGALRPLLKKYMNEELDWDLLSDAIPKNLVCYAKQHFEIEEKNSDYFDNENNIKITVANTASEALSAHLANTISAKYPEINRLQVENELEALQLQYVLEENQFDHLQAFKELRHKNGFLASENGSNWLIRSTSSPLNPDDAINNTELMPSDWATDLDQINHLQKNYDKQVLKIEEHQNELYSDWHKYITTAYPPEETIPANSPDIDLIKHFIKKRNLEPLTKRIKATGKLKYDDQGHLIVEKNNEHKTIADELSNYVFLLNQKIQNFNSSTKYELILSNSARFWEPSEPVILVSGDLGKSKLYHNKKERLECFSVKIDPFINQASLIKNANTLYDFYKSQKNSSLQWLSIYKKNPWNPIILQWQVQTYARDQQSNNHQDGNYGEQFITTNYSAPWGEPDLLLKDEHSRLQTNIGSIFSGQTVLSDQFKKSMLVDITEVFYKKNILEKAFIKNENGNDTYILPWTENMHDSKFRFIQYETFFEKSKNETIIDFFSQWLKSINIATILGKNTYLHHLALAFLELLDDNIDYLSQSLGGFNDSLLMKRNSVNLDIKEPLAYNEYTGFMQQVQNTIANEMRSAPVSSNQFSPIRAAALKLLKLRLVDTFGQTKDIDTSKIQTMSSMETPASNYLISLPPRIMQASRLNFRWLASENLSKNMEMNSHQSSMPVIAWIVVSRFDSSLHIFNANGKGLAKLQDGSSEKKGIITSLPIQENFSLLADESNMDEFLNTSFDNKHLNKLIRFLIDRRKHDPDFLISKLADIIIDKLEHIEPELSLNHKFLSLLISRPVAVVRSSVGLELAGNPAINQDWNMFQLDLNRKKRQTDSFEKVKIPLRLGRKNKVNDGLIGYWIENETGYKNTNLYHAENEPIQISLDDEPVFNTMLVDVQAKVNASVGILPNKEISIPHEYYAESLKNIEVFFLSAPLPSNDLEINIPIPQVSGYDWDFVMKNQDKEFEEIPTKPIIRKNVFIDVWNELQITDEQKDLSESIWNHLLSSDIKWLISLDEQKNSRAIVIEGDERGKAELGEDYAHLTELINLALIEASEGIISPSTEAQFNKKTIIREGWLKLKKI